MVSQRIAGRGGKCPCHAQPDDFSACPDPVRHRDLTLGNSERPGGGMADTKVLEAFAVRCAGSSPVPGTNRPAKRKPPAQGAGGHKNSPLWKSYFSASSPEAAVSRFNSDAIF